MKFQDPEEQIAQILLNLPCSLFWIDRNRKHVGCNIECCGIFGLPPQEILGKDFSEISQGKFYEPFATELAEIENLILETGTSKFQSKYTITAPDAKLQQLFARVPLFDLKRTSVLGILCAGIFDREFNSSFKNSLENLTPDKFMIKNHPVIHYSWSEIFHMFPCSIWWIDRDHKFCGANFEYCRTVGVYSYIELLGKTIMDVGRLKKWPEYKAKNIHDLDESLMLGNYIGYNVENIMPPNKNTPSIRQIIAKKPMLDKNNKVTGLMCVAVYNGKFGEKSEWIN